VTIDESPVVEAVLAVHAGALGTDAFAYRHHVYRVLNLCAAQLPGEPEQLDKIAIAAAFHDLGIWAAGTFDYIEPSVRLARDHLVAIQRADWTREVTAMIREHHKVSRYRGDEGRLVEPFRRADWADVSLGLIRNGLPRSLVRQLFAMWPSAGFHRRLVQLELHRLRTHPLRPLPMVKL